MDSVPQFTRRLDTLLEGIQVIDRNWRYVYLNDVMVEQARASKEELLGYTMMEAYPGIEHSELFGYLTRTMNERITFRIENRFVYPDQTERWFDLQIEPDQEGICILSVDITDYKEEQEKVRANEKRFRALIEKSADMKTMATADGRLIYGSPSITKILGYTLEEMRGKVIFDLFHPDDRGAFIKNREKILNQPGSSFQFQLRARHKNGGWIWCEGNVTNLLEEPGINAVVSNFTDISESKHIEHQREFDRNNLYALINNSTDMMWSVDLEYRLITSNKPYDRIIQAVRGINMQKGDSTLDSTPPHIAKWLATNYQRAFSGEIFTETVQNAGRWFAISFHPIRKDNMVVGTACHSRDITEQKHAEEQMLLNNAELQKTNLELDRFVYSISHDLRSPLTSILGLLSLIEEESKESETLRHVKMIRAGIDRLDTFIKNILSYARNNRTGLVIEKVPLRATVDEIIDALRSMKDADGITFINDIPETLTIHTDRQSVTTILENLISNAIKFRRTDAGNSCVCIAAHKSGNGVNIALSDNGIGIHPDFHDKVFEMFFRVSGTVDGSGIGLYLVREIVKKLGGTIKIESVDGSGTTFYVQLQNATP